MLDADAGLARCGGKASLYHRLLESFFHQYQPWVHSHPDAALLPPEQVQQLAHNLKSIAPAVGATQLSTVARELAPPAPPPTSQQSGILLSTLTDALLAVQTQFPRCCQNDRVKELLRRLEQHNIEALYLYDEWVSEQASHWPQSSLAAIRNALNDFNFEQAQSLLQRGLRDFAAATVK